MRKSYSIWLMKVMTTTKPTWPILPKWLMKVRSTSTLIRWKSYFISSLSVHDNETRITDKPIKSSEHLSLKLHVDYICDVTPLNCCRLTSIPNSLCNSFIEWVSSSQLIILLHYQLHKHMHSLKTAECDSIHLLCTVQLCLCRRPPSSKAVNPAFSPLSYPLNGHRGFNSHGRKWWSVLHLLRWRPVTDLWAQGLQQGISFSLRRTRDSTKGQVGSFSFDLRSPKLLELNLTPQQWTYQPNLRLLMNCRNVLATLVRCATSP